jgi:hypothetical protein
MSIKYHPDDTVTVVINQNGGWKQVLNEEKVLEINGERYEMNMTWKKH